MAWLRIDDGYTSNSKIAQLSDSEFRAWMRLLCHCARSRDPSVDDVAIREVSGLSRARIRRYASLGLVDEIGDSFEVHDWTKFLPKDEQNAARQAKWRARKRNEASNAPSNAPSNANPSRTGAGTRGFPSRPVQEQDQNQQADRQTSEVDAAAAGLPAEDEHEDEPEIDEHVGPMAQALRSELGKLRTIGGTA